MIGYTIIPPLSTDEKIGYELHPIGGDGSCNIEIPTPEQVFELWATYFEPLLLSSDNHNAELLAEFESDILTYVKTKISIV